ncbi:MAG: hypothetical protein JWL59_4434 [Chthoniobacteraceae bacterium]|nr:hypothetical protein [Chthoniobacteraceae bacterium]
MNARPFICFVLHVCLLIGLGACKAPITKPVMVKTVRMERPVTTISAPHSSPREIPGELSTLYQGPAGLTGWISYNPRGKDWRYAGKALWTKSASWIGRDVHLPERSAVEFTLSNPGLIEAFFVGLYTHVPLKVTYSPVYHVANYYTLGIFRGTLLFNKLDAEGHDKNLGETPNLYFYPRPEVRVKILTDKRAKKFWVFFDGTQVAHWEDAEPFAGEGTGITFQAFAGEDELSVSEIKVSVWDGSL